MAAATPPYPLSPWAKRFASALPVKPYPDYVWDGLLHSSLAPEFPRFDDPIHYADITGKLPIRVPPSSNEELDRLFRTEGHQMIANQGLRTWEAAILNYWVRFSSETGHISAGHLLSDTGENAKALQDVFDLETIQVDESRWEFWLRKDHWLDWVEPSPQGGGAPRTWTVDDPKIWSVLRISIELVDRMIKALIDEKHDAEQWRDVVPRSMGQEPDEGAGVLLSHFQEQEIARLNGTPCEYDSMTTHSKSEWTERLGELLDSQLLGFGKLKGIDGTSSCLPGTPAAGITLLSIRKLDVLCNGTQLTLLHEITHSLTRARILRPAPGVAYPCPTNGFPEPIPDCEGMNEIGFWFEQQVFGGVCDAHDIPIASHSTEMPTMVRLQGIYVDGAWMNADATTRLYHIPTSWHSRLLSEDFWKASGVPSKTKNFFHRASIFLNESPSVKIPSGQWEETQAIYPDPEDDTYEENLRIVQHWYNRHNVWKYLREVWYEDEYFQWSRSPWYYFSSRGSIETFRQIFAEKDEVGCALVAQSMTERIVWFKDQETFNQYIPPAGIPDPDWISHCIGLIMLGAIPIREKGVERPDIDRGHSVTLSPSKEMVAKGLTKVFELAQPPIAHDRGDYVSRSEFYDHINGRGRIRRGFSQLDYLTLAADVVSRVTSYALVHFSWINAINSAIQTLRKDRLELQAKYPDGHAAQWATDWPFQTPKYDKEVGRYNADGSTRAYKFDTESRAWRSTVASRELK